MPLDTRQWDVPPKACFEDMAARFLPDAAELQAHCLQPPPFKWSLDKEPCGKRFSLSDMRSWCAAAATTTTPHGGAQKGLMILDQSGNQTRLLQCPFPLTAEPVKLSEEFDENYGKESEMHEDTEEINALLYSDDDYDDEDCESDDEVMSTGHSPYQQVCKKRVSEEIDGPCKSKAVELDYQWIEFDDVRYHVQVTMKNPSILLLSVSLPNPPPEAMSFDGLPLGAIEAIKTAYGTGFQILDPPRDGFSLTLKLNFSKLRPDEAYRNSLLTKLASIREVVMGAPLKIILRHLASRTVAPELDRLVAIMHRPNETFFLVPQADKVTVAFPMRFKDSVDTILATSFLKQFVEARRAASLSSAPSCSWSPTAPQELEGAPKETLSANAGFVTFVIMPRHVEGEKLDRTVWNLSTFHAYVSYHVKCSEGFMHTRMRRRVESMIQALDQAKPLEKTRSMNNKSFKRLGLNDVNSK